MSDLISRGELFNRLANVWTIEDAYAVIQDMPTKEPDIIRCRDCKHWINLSCYEREHIEIGIVTYETDHCSWAERRTDE